MSARFPSRKLKIVFGFYLRLEWRRWVMTFHRPRVAAVHKKR